MEKKNWDCERCKKELEGRSRNVVGKCKDCGKELGDFEGREEGRAKWLEIIWKLEKM